MLLALAGLPSPWHAMLLALALGLGFLGSGSYH